MDRLDQSNWYLFVLDLFVCEHHQCASKKSSDINRLERRRNLFFHTTYLDWLNKQASGQHLRFVHVAQVEQEHRVNPLDKTNSQ